MRRFAVVVELLWRIWMGVAKGFCGTTAPIGYATKNGDCCDDTAHLAIAQLIHPGAAFQTTSAGGVCNITWDYDCSGAITTSVQTCTGGCSAYPACDCLAFTQIDPPYCGMGTGVSECGIASTGNCITVGVGAGTLGCK